MLIEAAHRAEAAAKQLLAGVNSGSASCAELREMLAVSKATMAILSTAQTSAASVIARAERHGDGGTQVLADTAGLTRHEARSQVTTAQAIEAVPAVREALEAGRVSQANAKRLAEAIDKTGADTVESDPELLAKAESMRPEQFTREARRWTADRQDDRGEADYQRLRAKRRVRVWDADDGLVHLHGEFDPVAGRRIANRLRAEAGRLYDADKKQAAARSEGGRRSFDQCMADALDNLTSNGGDNGGKPFADICVVAHLDADSSKLVAETPEGQRLPDSVLEEFACNAKFTGLLYDHDGKPIWRAHSVRSATKAQRQILFARYGGCFHCAAHPAMCQIHHIKPVSQGGTTKLDNMVPVCWDCHQRIHRNGWQIHTRRGKHSLHPPDRTHYGPAHAPEQPILQVSGAPPDFHPPARPSRPARSQPETASPPSRTATGIRPSGACQQTAGPPGRTGSGASVGRRGLAAARAALSNGPAERDTPPTEAGPRSQGASAHPTGPPVRSGQPQLGLV